MAAFDFNITNPKEHKIQCEEALEKKPNMLKLNLQFLLQTILIHYKKFLKKKKSHLKKKKEKYAAFIRI